MRIDNLIGRIVEAEKACSQLILLVVDNYRITGEQVYETFQCMMERF